ncbi:DUF6545 domain-containing protein [Sciscionella marina]|uniref:DUF6545 domain-containing protein n=1 Tax=Sciscionella marina TaxID=508770 RepID=UPI00037AF313|nr:DUF6545 domain-containing protein [Sciscionella marina]
MPDWDSVLWYVAAAGALIEAVRKVVVNRGVDHLISRDYTAVALMLIGVSMAAGAKTTQAWSDRILGVDNVSFVVHCLAAVGATVCGAGLLRALGRLPVRVRTVGVAALLCAVALLVLYFCGGLWDPAFGASLATAPTSRAYTLIYLAYMLVCLSFVILGLWIPAGPGENGRREYALQIGILLTLGGALLVWVVLAWTTVFSVEALFTPVPSLPGLHTRELVQAVGVVLLVAGFAIASATRGLQRWSARKRGTTARESIHELWRFLHRVPVKHRTRERGRRVGIAEQLMEIRDAQLVLRLHVPTTMTTALTAVAHNEESQPDRAALLAEAIVLRCGLQAMTQGLAVQWSASDDIAIAPQDAEFPASDLSAEFTWLAELSTTVFQPRTVTLARDAYHQWASSSSPRPESEQSA